MLDFDDPRLWARRRAAGRRTTNICSTSQRRQGKEEQRGQAVQYFFLAFVAFALEKLLLMDGNEEANVALEERLDTTFSPESQVSRLLLRERELYCYICSNQRDHLQSCLRLHFFSRLLQRREFQRVRSFPEDKRPLFMFLISRLALIPVEVNFFWHKKYFSQDFRASSSFREEKRFSRNPSYCHWPLPK